MTKYIAKWYDGEVVSGVLHDFAIGAIGEGRAASLQHMDSSGEYRGYSWEAVHLPDPAPDQIEIMEPLRETGEPSNEDLCGLMDMFIEKLHHLSLPELYGLRDMLLREYPALDLLELTSPTVTTQEDTKSVILESGE